MKTQPIKSIKTKPILTTALLLCWLSGAAVGAPFGSAFTYQGRLAVGNQAAGGLYDFRFVLYDAPVDGVPVAGPVTNWGVAVSNGLFTASLDFGPGVFAGEARWLEIAVRTNDPAAPFEVLAPRTALTPAPQALYAASAGAASSVPASGILGTVSLTQLPPAVLTNNASGVNVSGTFSGNGAGVTNVNLLSVNTHGAIGWATNIHFQPACSPTVPAESVTTADVNDDGVLELIVGGGGRISVLTNNGHGCFGLATWLTVGRRGSPVRAADLNSDGQPDLACVNWFDHTLSVITNRGGGDFGPVATYEVGARPTGLVTVDVNGDGQTDLVAANSGTNTLSVLTNAGGGQFVAYCVVLDKPGQDVAAADVNADGRPDLIVAHYLHGRLSVLTNDGGGGFSLARSLNVVFPSSVTTADMNGDARADLITASDVRSAVTVFTNNSNGEFMVACLLEIGSPLCFATVGDINSDNKPDVIGVDRSGNSFWVITNSGHGNLAVACRLAVGREPTSVTAADLNGDGRTDLVSANSGDATLSIMLNVPTYAASFAGNASSLTDLNASQLTSGTVPDARLSTNVARLDATQTFSGANTFSHPGNSFVGDGAGLTGLNAAALTTGTVPEARLSTNVSLLGQSIESAEITDGTIVDADLSPAAAIADTKLATINTPGKVANSATTASSANTPNAIVARDGSGNFAAGTITAAGFAGSGAALTNLNASALTSGTVPVARLADNSIGAAKLASDPASLAKVSGGAVSLSGATLTVTGAIASAQSSAMQISPLHARPVDAGLTIAPVADHYGAILVSAASAGTYRLVVPLDIPLRLYGRTPTSWAVTTHYSHASTNNYITRTRVFCSHVAEIAFYQEDQTDRTSSTHSSFTVAGPNLFAEEWRGKAIEYQVTLSAGGSLRIGSILVNYTY